MHVDEPNPYYTIEWESNEPKQLLTDLFKDEPNVVFTTVEVTVAGETNPAHVALDFANAEIWIQSTHNELITLCIPLRTAQADFKPLYELYWHFRKESLVK